MEDPSEIIRIPTPSKFDAFPYNVPYGIQSDLMAHLFAAIESRSLAIIESPTGTGKTLSLLTSSLTWLRENKTRSKHARLADLRQKITAESDESEPQWVIEQSLSRQQKALEAEENDFERRLDEARRKEEIIRRKQKGKVVKRARVERDDLAVNEDQYLPDDDRNVPEEDDNIFLENLTPEVREQLKQLKSHSTERSRTQPEDPIYFASRTHTQLSQTITELLKITGGSDTRSVSLGSRKNTCINEDLKERGGDLDEACRELNSREKGSRCPHLPSHDEESKLFDFRDHILASPKDIEDLVEIGKELKTCPYYGSLTLPYNLLLQKSAREALGISLEDHIVIIDEAHNLIDTVLSINSHVLSSRTLQLALAQLKAYHTKFKNRLSPRNALSIKRVVMFIAALDGFCKSMASDENESGSTPRKSDGAIAAGNPESSDTTMMTVGELVSRLNTRIDGLNLLEMVQYLRDSKLARKISGYCDDMLAQASKEPGKARDHKSGAAPPLHAVEAFLLVLTSPNHQGRVFVTVEGPFRGQDADRTRNAVTLKYQLLNPEDAFRDVIEEARSVILAGGTMSPMFDIQTQLFPNLPEDRIAMFTCGHVIPSSSLQTLVITHGPRKKELKFKFDNRGNNELTEELGLILANLVVLVPHGLVIFFPSHSFLQSALKIWEERGVMTRIRSKKNVFLEPADGSSVDGVLRDYSATIATKDRESQSRSPRGAVLMAVVSGRLSEGLNFSDDLARGVVVIGLPYANLGSRELKERMNFVRRKGSTGGKDAGMELYENICMKAVNQSIGRAIRHKNDWASLILIDQRYSTSRIQNKLPNWIRSEIIVAKTWGDGIRELGAFYRRKREEGALETQ
ncbi:DNA repair helicase [Cantharellus anzutake]|uniref:DNA repair helicase n=1 Tax=Cantharellus anzutake TaxID=1750568 RepID=UPI0019084C66|nr:DNA repair helicase [Cantharellus anzutake]KAF8333493.1 DNA repair helicase [Cantharellus anzutake]